jgi:heptaprenyl diphosphate synthase
MISFWNDLPELQNELEVVRGTIRQNSQSGDAEFQRALIEMVDSGGKMLRPAFLILSAQFGHYDAPKIQSLAAVVEMLHMATLVHDDIVDDARLRRGIETVQSKYGKDYAVYLGDYLFCQCFMMLSAHEYTRENLQNISKAIMKICMGEIKQYNFRYNVNMSLKNYLRVISGKTAALFAMSFYAGAFEAGCEPKLCKTLGHIGYDIGMAFQVIDDLLDYNGDSEKLGKSAQRDLQRGFYTLPLLYAMETPAGGKIALGLAESALSEADVTGIVALVKESGSVERARKIADRYTQRAMMRIESLPEQPSKYALKQLAGKLIGRDY